jgi:hypothetical protein
MTIYGDIDEELRQRFAMLHLAWDEAYWTRKKDPTVELRSYLHILGGVNANVERRDGVKALSRS